MVKPHGVRHANLQRTRSALLEAAASTFVAQGVQAPVRDIAGRAGVGIATLYRHFPTRADLVSAVYRHQVEECTALASRLRDEPIPAADALDQWVAVFVNFLVTKHGLSSALGSDDPSLTNLHHLLLEELVPACASLLLASQRSGEVDRRLTAYTLLRAVGNLCIPGPDYGQDEAKKMVTRLLAGCRNGTAAAPRLS